MKHRNLHHHCTPILDEPLLHDQVTINSSTGSAVVWRLEHSDLVALSHA